MSINIVFPNNLSELDDLNIEKRVLIPFSDVLVDFVDDVSKRLLLKPMLKQYPELVSLGFWMRRAHINQLKNEFFKSSENRVIIGKGVVFHLAPSNVDTIFVYSWFLSLLVGNSNILRISSKENIQTNLLLRTISEVLNQKEYEVLQRRIAIIRYGHDDTVTAKLSMMADIRVIWGGDSTVQHIRSIPIKATASELTFADKFSFAIIKSVSFLETSNRMDLLNKFYNDSFWFGQMACSSMRMVVWVGRSEDNEAAKNIFWQEFSEIVRMKKPQDIAPADIVNKIVAECSMAIEHNVSINKVGNDYINVIRLKTIADLDEELHCGSGLFYEIECEKINQIFNIVTKKHQTIAQYGFSKDELQKELLKSLPEGIDRIVPIGQSLDFSNIWDGYDLLNSFCREIEVVLE